MTLASDGEEHGGIDQAWRILGLVNDWLKHAEAKAGLALATAGVLGGLLYSIATSLSDPKWWTITALVVAVICVVSAGVCGAMAVVPRLWRKDPATSKIYYDHIARAYPKKTKKHPSRLLAFQRELTTMADDKSTLFDELSAQIWTNAHVASAKYKWSTWAIVFVIAAAVGTALTAVFGTWDSR